MCQFVVVGDCKDLNWAILIVLSIPTLTERYQIASVQLYKWFLSDFYFCILIGILYDLVHEMNQRWHMY